MCTTKITFDKYMYRCIYLYVLHILIYVYMYLYIHTYIYRERVRMYVCMYNRKCLKATRLGNFVKPGK